ncbi:MAG: hypothetical protein JWQ35_1794 [Bacteriovoracaceae bacterium]|nr:hypothetical protein [Bacteriovoracaceae bacterium]
MLSLFGFNLSWSTLNATSPIRKLPENSAFQMTEKLIVSPFPDKIAVTEKSEEAGIADIRELITTSKNEEAWFFVHNLNAWFEASTGQVQSFDSGNRMVGVYVNLGGAEALFHHGVEITLYHFHPVAILRSEAEIEKTHSNEKRTLNERTIKTLQAWENIQLHMPSFRDFISLAEILKTLKTNDTQKKLNAKIATPLGIVEYSLTEEGRQFVETHDAQQIEALLNDRFSEFQVQKLKTSTPLLRANLRTKVSVIQEAVKSLEGKEFKINFTPHSDIQLKMRPAPIRLAKAALSLCKKVLSSFH